MTTRHQFPDPASPPSRPSRSPFAFRVDRPQNPKPVGERIEIAGAEAPIHSKLGTSATRKCALAILTLIRVSTSNPSPHRIVPSSVTAASPPSRSMTARHSRRKAL